MFDKTTLLQHIENRQRTAAEQSQRVSEGLQKDARYLLPRGNKPSKFQGEVEAGEEMVGSTSRDIDIKPVTRAPDKEIPGVGKTPREVGRRASGIIARNAAKSGSNLNVRSAGTLNNPTLGTKQRVGEVHSTEAVPFNAGGHKEQKASNHIRNAVGELKGLMPGSDEHKSLSNKIDAMKRTREQRAAIIDPRQRVNTDTNKPIYLGSHRDARLPREGENTDHPTVAKLLDRQGMNHPAGRGVVDRPYHNQRNVRGKPGEGIVRDPPGSPRRPADRGLRA